MGFEIENGYLKKYTKDPGISNVVIPSGVVCIGSLAFSSCYNYLFDSIIIPDGVTSIERKAFLGCYLCMSIYIPASVIHFGIDVFPVCPFLTIHGSAGSCAEQYARDYNIPFVCDFEINDGVVINYNEVPGMKNIVIPEGVVEIGDRAFSDCISLESVTIPSSVKKIGQKAFQNCINLTNINIPDILTDFSSDVFTGCRMLTDRNGFVIIKNRLFNYNGNNKDIYIPDNVISIEKCAFLNCTTAETISIPNSVKVIGSEAFYGCSSLKSVSIPNGVEKIDAYTFNFCSSLESINIPDSVTEFGFNIFRACDKLADNNGFIILKKRLFCVVKDRNDVTIPDGVTTIEGGAFYFLSNLKML